MPASPPARRLQGRLRSVAGADADAALALGAFALLALIPVLARRIWRRKLGASVPPKRI